MMIVFSESWQIFQKVRILTSRALTHTMVGRWDPYGVAVIFVPKVMASSTAVTELGEAERKKAL